MHGQGAQKGLVQDQPGAGRGQLGFDGLALREGRVRHGRIGLLALGAVGLKSEHQLGHAVGPVHELGAANSRLPTARCRSVTSMTPISRWG
jgi:hypothetical protein